MTELASSSLGVLLLASHNGDHVHVLYRIRFSVSFLPLLTSKELLTT